jgi:hypothetical protein
VALHRLLADEELLRNVGVRHPVREKLQDLALARREHVLALTREEARHERRIDVTLAVRDLLDRPEEGLMRSLLEDVALRAGLEAAPEEGALAVGREDEDGGLGKLLRHNLRRLEPIHPGHADVHDDDVRTAALGDRDCAGPVRRLADDADVGGAREREAKAFSDDLVVVGYEAGDLVWHAAPDPLSGERPRSFSVSS